MDHTPCASPVPFFHFSRLLYYPFSMMLAATLLFSATALIAQVAAGARPRVPITLLRPSQSYVMTGSASDLVARANGCPVGWAVCSSITCYPLDGSECCSGTPHI